MVDAENTDAKGRQFALAQEFGIHAVDMGTKSFDVGGGTHISIDRSADSTSMTIHLAPGDKIFCDDSMGGGQTDEGIKVRSGARSIIRPIQSVFRRLSGEKALMRSFENVTNVEQTFTLKSSGSTIVAIDLEKAGGMVKSQLGSFVAGMAGKRKEKTKVGISLKPWTNILAGDRIIRQKVQGKRYAFFGTNGALSLKKLEPGERTLVCAQHFLASSSSISRGFGMKFHFLSKVMHGDNLLYLKLKNKGKKSGYVLIAPSNN